MMTPSLLPSFIPLHAAVGLVLAECCSASIGLSETHQMRQNLTKRMYDYAKDTIQNTDTNTNILDDK